MWCKVYGDARTADRLPRFDMGTKKYKKTASEEVPTLTEWVRGRRKHVDLMLEAVGTADMAAEQMADEAAGRQVGSAGWTEKHAKESDFNKRKEINKLLESINDGTALPSDVTPELLEAAQLYKQLERVKAHQYAAKHRRKHRALSAPERPNLCDRKLFVDPRVRIPDTAAFEAAKRQLRVEQVFERSQGTLYIVPDVAHPGQRISWHCSLGGHPCCDITYFMSLGERGPAVVYRQATKIKKLIFCSDDFRRLHPEVYTCLTAEVAKPNSKWVWLPDKAAVLREADRRSRMHAVVNKKLVVVFCSKSELKRPDEYPHVRCKFDSISGLKQFRHLDITQTSNGVCGR